MGSRQEEDWENGAERDGRRSRERPIGDKNRRDSRPRVINTEAGRKSGRGKANSDPANKNRFRGSKNRLASPIPECDGDQISKKQHLGRRKRVTTN